MDDRAILRMISDYIAQNGYAPSMREIADLCGFSSTSAVHYRLMSMQERGLIERMPHVARGMRVIGYPYAG